MHHVHRFLVTVLLPITFFLSACAHTWVPGPGMNAEDLGPEKARCSYIARHGGSGFAAAGSPRYVAAAALGNAIGEAFRAQQDFNDCMEASGWRIADQPRTAGSAQPITQTTGASSYPFAAMSKDRRIQIVLPPGWVRSDPPDTESDFVIFARQPSIDAVLGVEETPKEDIPDLQAFVQAKYHNPLTQVGDPVFGQIRALSIEGYAAFRYEVAGTLRGVRLHIVHTFADTGAFIVHVVILTTDSRFEAQRSEFDRIIRTLSELKPVAAYETAGHVH
ncbi:MAG: hypothetical protein JO264_09565 [Acidisphaera sp.]|nr:hypothetical protein [Acidisphaera sp.]